MSSTMADDVEASRNIRLRKQLAVAVRSLQWNYAIFWSSSQIQVGVLEWGEGYYNGDIKKRKKRSYEVDSKYGLQRSKQLRNLYLRMLEGDTHGHGHGHGHGLDDDDNTSGNVMLSPDDLSDEEWYYLVCMSYVFSPAHCLPGKALATGETIWLCNAQHAETKLFTRSLLARSASFQTVVCFPYLGGVIERGVTELIAEDRNLIQHIKDCLSETSNLEELEDGNHQIWSESDEDLQHKKTLSNDLKFAANRSERKDFGTKGLASSGSSFLRWKSSSLPSDTNRHQKQSNVLWKILHAVPLMHSGGVKTMFQTETTGLNQCVSMEYDDDPSDKIKENENFSVLKYMVDKESIEETSETEQKMMKDETEVRVKLKESEVLIEVRCFYRDYIVADIMEAVSNLNMDAFSIRSHTQDGFLSLNLKAKFRGAAVISIGMVKRELQRVTCEN